MKIIADTHFGHENILKYESIRIKAYKEAGYNNFDKFLVDRLNSFLNDNDKIYHLGDVAFKDGYKYASKLKGNYTLIVGNHDKMKHLEYYKSLGWNIIENIDIRVSYDKKLLHYLKRFKIKTACIIEDIGDKRILFSHYPISNDNPYDEKYKENTELLEFLFHTLNCDINIHGHTHSYTIKNKRCINACVEVNEFKPINLAKLLSSSSQT